MNYTELANNVLDGALLQREQCRDMLNSSEENILELLHAAYIIRKKYFGKKVVLQLLINAKAGHCPEDCSYCSQSLFSDASIQTYPILEEDSIVDGAFSAKKAKAKRYCIVTSGRSTKEKELERVLSAVKKIKEEVDIEICTSLGFLTEEGARILKEAGVNRYNHNINASERFYPEICTTHSFKDRIQTILHAKAAGLEICSGVLFGLGESNDDIIDSILTLRELSPDCIPVNFYHPKPGNSLEKRTNLSPLKCLVILCLIRFLVPQTEIKVAGGREYHLRSLQSMALYPANSLFVAGYLTTDGQAPSLAWQMIKDMGFEIEEEKSVGLVPS